MIREWDFWDRERVIACKTDHPQTTDMHAPNECAMAKKQDAVGLPGADPASVLRSGDFGSTRPTTGLLLFARMNRLQADGSKQQQHEI